MPDGLYERDVLVWAETQADLLRRLAAGERVNASIDWPNVIEEVQDVGVSQLRACESLLLQGLLHVLKLLAWPGSRSADHWDDEADTFLNDARRAFTPSMRQRLDVAEIYTEALRRARRKHDDAGPAHPLADTCPITLDDLLSGDVDVLRGKLGSSVNP